MNHSPPAFFEEIKARIDKKLSSTIAAHSQRDSRLSEALRYSTILGGKRIRPILLLTTANCFGTEDNDALPAACAVELIHAYSLIHDDLPAMDDDALRRGQPTCHIAFDEPTAILAGDALQTMAFELLAQASDLPAASQLEMIRILARASGARGMVLGQAIDLESVGLNLTLTQLQNMHLHKTGALIEASVLLGALTNKPFTSDEELAALKDYARAIGLAFQVQDDILDVVSDTEVLGKTQGADEAMNKPTYPALLGLKGARQKLADLNSAAKTALSKLSGRDTTRLATIADYIVERTK